MGRRGWRRASVIGVCTLAAVLAAAPGAVAAEPGASDDDCGFSLWGQSYKNCDPSAEVVEVHYESWGPGTWVRGSAYFCIHYGETARVGLPDGSIATGGVSSPMMWCDDPTVVKDHPGSE